MLYNATAPLDGRDCAFI